MAKSKGKFNIVTFILAFFLLDKLVTASTLLGKIGLTVLKWITGGGLLIWWAIDLIMLLLNKYEVNPLDYLR